METQREDEENDGPAKKESGRGQHVAELGERNRRGVQQQTHIGGVNHEHAAEQAQAHGQEIEPARHFCGITDGFGAVHRRNRLRKHCIKNIRSAEAPEPQAVGPVHIRAH